jgi:predicted glycosyltransferase
MMLAEALVHRRPNADVLMISGSAGLHELAMPANVDYVKLPSIRKQATGRWRPYALDIEMEHLLGLRRTIILEAIRAYRPHLFVADFLPLGVEGELVPALEELAARPGARSAIGFRDVLDEPAAIKHAWDTDGTPEYLSKLYDLVLVYGEPAWFDFAAYGLDSPRYVGLLGHTREAPRSRSLADLRLVGTCGGGVDGYPVLAATLEAAGELQRALDSRIGCTVMAGPLMPEADFERLRRIGREVGARVHRFVENFPRRVAHSTAVVGMAGYNTVCEILSFRRPAVIVPRLGPSKEQPIRARILADRGLATVVPQEACTGRGLSEALFPLLDERPYPEDALPDLGGTERSVEALLHLIE